MTLDIIIPHYREPWKLCQPLFDSIALQCGLNWDDISVIVVHDGDECAFEDYMFGGYPFRVENIVKEHSGLSATRNRGLDESTADYVMFCDSDDQFINSLALKMIWMEMEKGKNIINPVFLEEAWDAEKSEMVYITHKSDATFIHGKCYRRALLVEHNIRFPDGLNLHEDGYFNSLAICCGQDAIVEINTPLYLWKWNKDSTVRRENYFTVRTYDKLCEVWRRGVKWLKDHGYEKEYRHVICKAVICSYYNFQSYPFMIPQNRKLRAEAERAFAKLYREFKVDFTNCDQKMISQFTEVLRDEAIKSKGFYYELITLSDWLKHIEKVK